MSTSCSMHAVITPRAVAATRGRTMPRTALAASMNARAVGLRAARPTTATLVAGQTRRQTTTMGLFGLGGPELLVIGVVAAVVFGPSKLPELGKTLGKTAKSFQGAAEEFKEELKKGQDEMEAEQKAKAAAEAAKPATPVTPEVVEEKKE